MATNGDETDDLLVAALACGASYAQAGAKAGCSEQTVYRRMKDAAFRSRVNESRAAMASAACGLLSRSLTSAAVTLVGLLKSQDERVKLAAAKEIFDALPKLRGCSEQPSQNEPPPLEIDDKGRLTLATMRKGLAEAAAFFASVAASEAVPVPLRMAAQGERVKAMLLMHQEGLEDRLKETERLIAEMNAADPEQAAWQPEPLPTPEPLEDEPEEELPTCAPRLDLD